MTKKRILVAMSGGVDSSVAAALCREAGHEVVGVSMRLHEGHGAAAAGSCCAPDDFLDARSVAQALDFPHYVLDLAARFDREVISDFVSEYLSGRTPIPCIRCNDALKFEVLRQKAAQLDCDAVATGHYARIEPFSGRLGLFTGIDSTRDQSYFLFTLTQAQMRQVLFPVGGMTKKQVRRKAAELGLRVAEKKESREICFVPEDDYAAFLESRSPGGVRPGAIVDAAGRVLGGHKGVHRYTVGQRHGLGIAWSEPLYVLALKPETAEVVVGTSWELRASGLIASRMNWTDGDPPAAGAAAVAKIRYRNPGTAATLHPLADGKCEIRFERPVLAVAPGQAAVLYQGDRVIGGGWIEKALSA